jgi:hypothetical protein
MLKNASGIAMMYFKLKSQREYIFNGSASIAKNKIAPM